MGKTAPCRYCHCVIKEVHFSFMQTGSSTENLATGSGGAVLLLASRKALLSKGRTWALVTFSTEEQVAEKQHAWSFVTEALHNFYTIFFLVLLSGQKQLTQNHAEQFTPSLPSHRHKNKGHVLRRRPEFSRSSFQHFCVSADVAT